MPGEGRQGEGQDRRRCIRNASAIGSMNRIMPAFVVLEPPGYPERAIEHADRFVFLRDRFSLGAFLFGPLWLIWRRLWLVLVAYVLAIALIGYGLRALGIGWSEVAFVFGLVHLLIGL